MNKENTPKNLNQSEITDRIEIEHKDPTQEKLNPAVQNSEQSTEVSTHKFNKKGNPIENSKINWTDYDSPCCFKLYHFNIKEVHPRIRPIFACLFANIFILIIFQFFKIVAHFFLLPPDQVSLVILIVLYPVSVILKLIEAYASYRGLFYDNSFKIIYKILALVLIVYSIFNASWEYIFDGIVVILNYKNKSDTSNFLMFILICEYIFNGIFLLIEILALILYCVVECKYDT